MLSASFPNHQLSQRQANPPTRQIISLKIQSTRLSSRSSDNSLISMSSSGHITLSPSPNSSNSRYQMSSSINYLHLIILTRTIITTTLTTEASSLVHHHLKHQGLPQQRKGPTLPTNSSSSSSFSAAQSLQISSKHHKTKRLNRLSSCNHNLNRNSNRKEEGT